LEAWYCVPADRDEPVVQIALAGSGPECGEVRSDGGRLVLELFTRQDGTTWVLPVDELLEVFRLAEVRLGSPRPT
jgi:hypothetical protein